MLLNLTSNVTSSLYNLELVIYKNRSIVLLKTENQHEKSDVTVFQQNIITSVVRSSKAIQRGTTRFNIRNPVVLLLYA